MGASSQEQSYQGKELKLTQAKPGDLLFFKRSAKSQIFHVSIVKEIKNNQVWMIHSSSTQGIVLENLSESRYWMSKLCKVTNVIN
jgi:cell wall-associated NlpC family hydrolase